MCIHVFVRIECFTIQCVCMQNMQAHYVDACVCVHVSVVICACMCTVCDISNIPEAKSLMHVSCFRVVFFPSY